MALEPTLVYVAKIGTNFMVCAGGKRGAGIVECGSALTFAGFRALSYEGKLFLLMKAGLQYN